MASLTEAVYQIVSQFLNDLVPEIKDYLVSNTPNKTGATRKSIVAKPSGQCQWVITGSYMLAQLERGDDPDIMNRKIVQQYTRHTSTGKSITVERTYTGQRPQKLWKKSAGGGNPWRVVPITPRPPMEITAKTMEQVLGEGLMAIAKKSFPSTIEITSLD